MGISGSCVATAESTGGSCVETAESVAEAATSWSSALWTLAGGSYVATAATCRSSSWVSKFDGLAGGSCVTAVESVVGSCVTATFSKRNDLTKSWAFFISVLEGEVGKDSGPWDCGGV